MLPEVLKSIISDTIAGFITGSIGDLFTFEYKNLKVCHAVMTKQNRQFKWSKLVTVHQINKEGEIKVTPIKIDKSESKYITKDEFEKALRKVSKPKKKKGK